MLKWILFISLSLNLFALELSIDSAKDNFSTYSTLLISDPKEFPCKEIKNDFDITTQIVCKFSKRPLQNIQKLQNSFFQVNSYAKKNAFFINIKPFQKIKLQAEIFNLYKEDSVYSAKTKLSKRWLVLGYIDKPPFIANNVKSKIGINFPFFLDKDKLPYVGSLDIKGNPVYIKKVGDVTGYIEVKKYYKEKKYEQCMSAVEEILASYPNTLFKAELIYYKIKLYSQLQDYDNVVSNAKIYLREYSADENIPEVLSLSAKAYSLIGLNTDADYFFDRLFSEHKDSKFSKWGYIYKGEMLEANGSDSKAIQLYKKALYSTSDLEVAASAAYKLAHIRQSVSLKDSAQYIDKIVKSKPDYFMQNYVVSKTMMHVFAQEDDFVTASNIAKALLDEIDATYDDYETLLKERALWLAKTNDKQEALRAIEKYLKQFPDGDYYNEIQVAKDSLFFDSYDENVSVRLAGLNKLISDYPNDSIGNRAIYEKAKLLLNEGRYNEALDVKSDLLSLDDEKYSDVSKILNETAIGAMKESLKENGCKGALKISNEYDISLSNEWDDRIYDCSMKGGDYMLSKSIIVKHLKADDLNIRKKWLFRYVKVNFATGNYSDVIGVANDLIILAEDDNASKYKETYRYLFDAYDRLEKKDKMIPAMSKIEDIYGLDYIDIERYVAIMSLGSQRKDDGMVIKYGVKIVSLQKPSSATAQSPYVEFTLYQSYVNRENYSKALEIIKSLDGVELNKTQRARQKYLLGTSFSKLWRDDEAQVAYEQAIQADSESAWAKLARSAKDI